MEDAWDLTERMLSDVLVCNVYRQFFHQNSTLFKGKVVLDVGCRTGLLSLLSIEAGAVRVFAMGNMKSAGHVVQVLGKGSKEEVFVPLNGCITQITLPYGVQKVDIIVSEWMGHALFADSLFGQVVYARDKWLTSGGHVIPNVANFYICGISQLPEKTLKKTLAPASLKDAYVDQGSVMTEKFILKTIDLCTCRSDLICNIEFRMKALQKGKVTGCMLYFDIGAINAKGQLENLFSIGPETEKTYLEQTVLFLEEKPIAVKEQDLLVGRFIMVLGNFVPRGVEFSMGLELHK